MVKRKDEKRRLFWASKTGDFLPLCTPSGQFRYGKEITTTASLCLLPLEMFYEGESFNNHEYRKESSRKQVEDCTYKC
jgi:hypothetical protein